jgi:hypothetical protein
MATYARIQNGIVAELFTPPAGVPIAACFHPALTWVECDSTPGVAVGWTAAETSGAWSFAAPVVPAPTPAQQAQAALAAGLGITSTSGGWTASFSVLTDATGASVWTLVLAEQAALSVNGNATFADGAATVQWPDVSGALHALTPAQFQAFAKALGAFVAGCRNVLNGVAGAAVPAASATIP